MRAAYCAMYIRVVRCGGGQALARHVFVWTRPASACVNHAGQCGGLYARGSSLAARCYCSGALSGAFNERCSCGGCNRDWFGMPSWENPSAPTWELGFGHPRRRSPTWGTKGCKVECTKQCHRSTQVQHDQHHSQQAAVAAAGAVAGAVAGAERIFSQSVSKSTSHS